MRRYLQKITKNHQGMAILFRRMLPGGKPELFPMKLEYLQNAARTVELDIKSAFKIIEKSLPKTITEADPRYAHEKRDTENRSFTCFAHCECCIMKVILRRWRDVESKRALKIIGVSKLSCLSCQLFFTAYTDALELAQKVGKDFPSLER